MRPEHHAGDEKAEHRADAGAVEQRHDHAGDHQEDDEALQALGMQHSPAPRLSRRYRDVCQNEVSAAIARGLFRPCRGAVRGAGEDRDPEIRSIARLALGFRVRSSAGTTAQPPERRLDRLERRVGLGAVGPAGLRHVGPAAAALAAERLGALAHQIDGVEARGEIGGDADDDAGLAVLARRDDRDDAGAELLLAFVGEARAGP